MTITNRKLLIDAELAVPNTIYQLINKHLNDLTKAGKPYLVINFRLPPYNGLDEQQRYILLQDFLGAGYIAEPTLTLKKLVRISITLDAQDYKDKEFNERYGQPDEEH